MAESIKPFENSLRDYLINAQADSYHSVQKIQYRYNNMKVYMDPKKLRVPHFTVSLGISEATFGIDPVDVLSGSLAGETRFVYLWASRPNINGELKKHWLFMTQQATADILNAFDDDKDKEKTKAKLSKQSEERRREEALEQAAAEYITGAGVKSAQTTKQNLNKNSNNQQE